MKPEEIIQKYIDGVESGQDNMLNAAIGKLSADRSKELSSSIQNFHHQIPITVSELRDTISRNTDKIITSNEKLAKSNVSYIQWMKYLTLALVLVGILQVVISLTKN